MSKDSKPVKSNRSAGQVFDVSVIVVNWNLRDMLRECLASVRDHAGSMGLQLIVVDNGSADGSADMVEREFPEAELIRNAGNQGFARANNQAMARASGRYVFLLNSDAMLHAGALPAMVEFMDSHMEAAACGPRVANPDGSLQVRSKGYYPSIPRIFAHFFLPGGMRRRGLRSLGLYEFYDSMETRPAGWVSGCALLLRRAAVETVGKLDADVFMYCEDVDWCYRMQQAGWKIFYVPSAEVTHYGGASLKLQHGRAVGSHAAGLVAFYSKHHGKAAALVFRTLVGLGYTVQAVGWAVSALRGSRSDLQKLMRMLSRA